VGNSPCLLDTARATRRTSNIIAFSSELSISGFNTFLQGIVSTCASRFFFADAYQVLPWVPPHHGARCGYSQLGSCIVKVRGVLQKGKLRLESKRERKARSEMGGKKT
jgi:hypothetical protein